MMWLDGEGEDGEANKAATEANPDQEATSRPVSSICIPVECYNYDFVSYVL